MKTICIINQKGGVGKSTISVNLSFGLSQEGKNTLLIDLDPQAHSSCIYSPDIPQKTIADGFINKNLNLKDLIFPAILQGTGVPNLDLIASNIKLATVAEQIAASIYRERILKKHLTKLEDTYDFVILDCPPTLGVIAINALYAADNIIIPTNYGKYSLDGMADLLNVVDEIKEHHDYAFFILRNMLETRNKQTNRFIEGQLKNLNKNLFSTVIRKNEAINQAQINNLPIQVFDPHSKGSDDFELLVQEVIRHVK